jgi:tetratricopeptide (TPR) repeat protein
MKIPFHLRPVAMTLLTCLTLALTGCRTACPPGGDAPPQARLFEGMGGHHRPVSTSSPRAQRFFDQALTWTFAFNHDEAIRSYTEAARLDPNCAMAWWGVALCHGPHINNPIVPRERRVAAWEAVQRAQALESHATPVERALIHAVAKRYAADPDADRDPMDHAYAEAMLDVWRAYPTDADVGCLAAEALMDLQPWDLWTHEGEPKGRATEIVAILERVMQLNPHHPGALHLYIHAVEASPNPSRAVTAADRLRSLVPAAGHLVHMPAHIDVRVGGWDRASDANVRAVEADRAYRRLVPTQGFYRVYMAHNHHFLAYAAMMEGRYEVARKAAKEMMASIPPEFIESSAELIDPVSSIDYDVLMRFGKWDELLAQPAPNTRLRITTAMWHFARATAHAARNELQDAEREQAAFRAAVEKIPPDAMMQVNPAHDTLAIAERVLAGEIAYRRGNIDESVALLRDAASREDRLNYMEPPEWIQPVRHSLGAILSASGRHDQAEAVYRQDLARWPENGWSLFGLAECLRARGSNEEAREVDARFRHVWRRADTQIHASCLCVR